jgi:DNA-binding GntR family transcriptional regulator
MASDHIMPTVSASGSAVRDPRVSRQIASEVRDMITSGQIVPGSPAPTITVLAARHGVARQTAAKALRLLVAEGLMIRYPGFGYYVISRPGCLSPQGISHFEPALL